MIQCLRLFETNWRRSMITSTAGSLGRLAYLHVERVDHLPTIHPGINSDDPYGKKKQKRIRDQRKKNKKNTSARPSYRFVDRCRLRVTGGMGGSGSLSLHRISRKRHFQPDGGHGGSGGSVILIADPNCTSLNRFRPHVSATKGSNGSSNQCHGARGRNVVLRVPPGVVVKRVLDNDEIWDDETKAVVRHDDDDDNNNDEEKWDNDIFYNNDYDANNELKSDTNNVPSDYDVLEDDEYLEEESDIEPDFDGTEDSGPIIMRDARYHDDDNVLNGRDEPERRIVTVADLDSPGSYVVVARGGVGGRGNCIFGRRLGGLPNPLYMAKLARPQEGEVAFLELELKLIADIGLVGFPNAGKSSLLRAMSAATPEVAAYPFTTLHPMIGCIEYRDGFRVQAADIPGLIDGASEGRGKGYSFLKHVERTKALLYVVDSASVDFRDPLADLRTLAKELASYGDGSLMDRRVLVVGNKVDLLHEDHVAELQESLKDTADDLGLLLDRDPVMISAGVSGHGLMDLSKAIRRIVQKSHDDTNERCVA